QRSVATGAIFNIEDNGIWTISRKGGLVSMKTRNCGSNMIGYHVASKASSYQKSTQHVVTNFGIEDNGTWCLAPKCDGDFVDIYCIKARNTGSEMVVVHADSASSGWKSRLIDVAISSAPEDNGQWLMVDFTHQKQPDLVYIKTRSTGTGKIEVRVVEPEEVVPRKFMRSFQNIGLVKFLTDKYSELLESHLQDIPASKRGHAQFLAKKVINRIQGRDGAIDYAIFSRFHKNCHDKPPHRSPDEICGSAKSIGCFAPWNHRHSVFESVHDAVVGVLKNTFRGESAEVRRKMVNGIEDACPRNCKSWELPFERLMMKWEEKEHHNLYKGKLPNCIKGRNGF
ncbi:hypothetical protein BGZ49_010512, partial [Haplosporangium sp. Z 27]